MVVQVVQVVQVVAVAHAWLARMTSACESISEPRRRASSAADEPTTAHEAWGLSVVQTPRRRARVRRCHSRTSLVFENRGVVSLATRRLASAV